LKILVVSARYPPHHFGGYGLRIQNITDALAHRGHSILVLSSKKEKTAQSPHMDNAYPVLRRLQLSRVDSVIDQMTTRRWSYPLGMLLVFIRTLWLDWLDVIFFDRQIKRFRPDVIYLGHITNLTRAILPYLVASGIPIIYDEGGSGLIDSWTEKGIWHNLTDDFSSTNSVVRFVKFLVISAVCSISRDRIKSRWAWPEKMQIIFNSELNYQNALVAGVPVAGASVIHSGVDINLFAFRPRERMASPLQVIVPGRIEPRKGQLDAVRCLDSLIRAGVDARLTLVGEKWDGAYFREIEAEIVSLKMEDKVGVLPMVEHERLAELYRQAVICFFASHYRTGFSRVPLEAMSSGCLVFTYGNEGSDEIIRDGQNGFLFPPGDYPGMVDTVSRLISKPDRLQDVVISARREIEKNHSMNHYMDAIEEFIMNTVELN